MEEAGPRRLAVAVPRTLSVMLAIAWLFVLATILGGTSGVAEGDQSVVVVREKVPLLVPLSPPPIQDDVSRHSYHHYRRLVLFATRTAKREG